jgi:plastocyanin
MVLAVCVAAALPALADAKTRSVTMGPPAAAAKVLNGKYLSDVNDYFPHATTINVGDKVRFVPTGFHTVDIPATGDDPQPLALPTGNTIAGANDAAGMPFWFNGQDELGFNPALFASDFGKTRSYNGSKGLNSGLPLAEKPKPFTVTFKKRGLVTYYCSIHPGMKASVRVLGKGSGAPSARQHRKAVKRQVARDIKIAKALPKKLVPAGTIDVGVAGPHGVEYFGMLPAKASIATNSILRFRMTPGSYEDHTATFGPGNPETEPTSYLGVMTQAFDSPVFDQRAVYPSEPPATTATYTPALHGNGFWNSGLMDNGKATPLPAFNSVRFGTPGTYTYYCLLHPFMKGQVVVG